jgi:hypothetical protein
VLLAEFQLLGTVKLVPDVMKARHWPFTTLKETLLPWPQLPIADAGEEKLRSAAAQRRKTAAKARLPRRRQAAERILPRTVAKDFL